MATDPKVQQVKDYMVKNPGSSYTDAAQSVVGIPKESLGDKNRRLQADFANKTAPAVTTPAIAQPAPTIAPITPVAPIAKQDYGFMGANNAPVQANIAPVVPPSSVSTPQAPTVAPTPIEAPKTETLGEKNARQQAEFAKTTKATTPTVDFNTSTGREQDILKNLNEAFNNAPALFQNQESYRQAYGYDTADQGKKAILDSFFAGKQTPTDTNSIFATLLSGGQITNPQITNTAEYKSAVGRIDKVNTIKGYDQSQISTLLAEGKLVPGTQLYKDLSTDPATMAKITNAQKLNVINKVPVNKDNVLANAAETVIDETPLGKAFKDGYISAEEADSFTRTPEIKAKEIEIEKKKTAYDALKAEYDDMENSVREELKGKASEGYIQALIGERQKNIFKRLNVLSSDYSNAMGTYSDMKKSLADTFQLNVGLYKDKQATIAASARDDKNFAQQKELVSLQQAYQNPDINSTNPQIAQIATQKLIDESLKFAQANGVPVTRNSGAILADAKAYAQKNGVSLAQAIQATFTAPLTEKPEYQAALDSIRSKNEPAGKLQVIGQRVDPATGSVVNVYGTVDKSGNIVEAGNNNATATQTSNDYAPGANSLKSLASKYPGVAAFKNDNPAGITWNANFENGTGTAKALQDAGINFSKGTARPAKEGGNYVNFDSIEDGLAAQRIIMEKTYGNSTVATLLSSWVGTGEGSAYANQVANMAGVDKNTTVNRLSQQQLDALQIAKIKKESPGLYNELQNKGVVDGNTINFSKVAPVDYNTALASEGTAGDFARSIQSGQFTKSGAMQGQSTQGPDLVPMYKEYLNSGKLPANTKVGSGNFNTFLDGYSKWKTQNNPLTDSQQKRVDSYSDDYSQQPVVKAYAKLTPVLGQYANTDVSKLSSSQQQSIISDFAKSLDPDSVVREGEYATVLKYAGQSLPERTLNSIKLTATGQGLLTEDAAKQLMQAIKSRADSYAAEEKAIREQAISKINRTSGNSDGESYLLIPGNRLNKPDIMADYNSLLNTK